MTTASNTLPIEKETTVSTEFILDLSKPTYHYEVSVWHYSGDRYSVDRDKGHGRATVYTTDSRDKALGVAEYLEQYGRVSYTDAGEPVTNEGEPFAGEIVHWDCGDVDHGHAAAVTVPGVSIGHGCRDCLRLAVEPRYLSTTAPNFAAVVTFTASHGTPREGTDGELQDGDGNAVTSLPVDLGDVPALIAALQGYVDAQAAAGDAMVDGWTVEQ